MTINIAVYGSGGFGREIAWAAECAEEKGQRMGVACFVDDDEDKQGAKINGLPVMGLDEARRRFPDARMVLAIGSPRARQVIAKRCEEGGWEFVKIIHPSTEISRWVEHGDGVVICAGNILTTNIRLGRQVQVNLDCTIGHDVIMDDFTTLAPGVHISGWVHLGKRVYVGTGAVLVNGTEDNPLIIGDDSVIGAGACVTKSVPARETWVGVPASVLKRATP